MNKIYLTAPLAALIVFVCIYSVHQSGVEKRDAEKKAKVEAALQAKAEAEQAARKAAMADAIAAAEQRKKEREAKAAQEAADREVRQAAIDARDKAYREQEKSARAVDRLKKEIETAEAGLTKLQAEAKASLAERQFLEDYVARAQTNVSSLQALHSRL